MMYQTLIRGTGPAMIAAMLLAGCDGKHSSEGDADTATDTAVDTVLDTTTDAPTDTSLEPVEDPSMDTMDEPDAQQDAVSDPAGDVIEDLDIPEGGLPPGSDCTESEQCAGDAICVSGEVTTAYCAPLCTEHDQCQDEATGMCGQCMELGGYQFCMYYCQIGGMVAGCSFTAVCPGDMECDGAVCR